MNHIHLYMCTSEHKSKNIYTCTCVHIRDRIFGIYIEISMDLMEQPVHGYTYVDKTIYMHVYIHIYVHIYIYIYVHNMYLLLYLSVVIIIDRRETFRYVDMYLYVYTYI